MQCIVTRFFLESMQSSDTGSEDYAYSRMVDCFIVQLSIFYCLIGCHKGILTIEVVFTGFLAVELIVRIEVLNLTC